MTQDRSRSRSAPYLRVGLVAGVLLAAGGLMLLAQRSTQAQTGPFTPQTAAHFAAENKLVVGVTLNHPHGQGNGTLVVEVLNENDKVLAQSHKTISRQQPISNHRFEVDADQKQADGLSVRVRLGNNKAEMPLRQILLVKGHETALLTGEEFFSGSTAPIRCEVHGVRNVRENVPLTGAEVLATLEGNGKKHTIFEARTDKEGRADGKMQIPQLGNGQYILEVVTRSALGEETLKQNVRIKGGAKILLVSDKPLYQPGQLMHLRALALREFDLKPVAASEIIFEVEDSKGNKVYKKALKTSTFGVASVDFQLADEVNMGNYNVRALLGEQRAEKTVQVKQYQLPKFKVQVTADKQFYLPKETVHAELQADYFFGKPVSQAKVKVTASTFDIAFREFKTWEGVTDAKGHLKFDIPLPDYFVGQPLQKGNALVKLDVKLTDSADHSEQIVKSYTVSDQPIQVSLIPEGGKLAPNMENRVFAAAIYPDGSPAQAEVRLWIGKEAKGDPIATVKTNAAGLAEFKLKPKAEQFRQGNWGQQTIESVAGNRIQHMPQILLDVHAEAQDKDGHKAHKTEELNSNPLGANVLLRLNKAIYQSADTLEADIRTSAGLPTVFLDIVRGGQIVLSQWFEVKDGKAVHSLDLPQDLFGSLEVHAYQMLASGEIIRDSRVIYVQPRNDLNIEVKADKSIYAPGANGRIHFQVTGKDGKGTAAALGIIVVDEAVYALQELQPGLEKVYFTLQEQLLQPQAQVLKTEDINNLVLQPALPAPKQQVAEVLLTAAKVQPPARWQVNPGLFRRNQYETQIQQIGWGVYRYAWQHELALRYDEANNRWEFRPNLLEELTRKGFVWQGLLQDPFGQKISLETLQKSEDGFTGKQLADGITQQRMEEMAAALVEYTDAHKEKFLKNGQWQLPQGVLLDAAWHKKLDEHFLRDAWGQGFKLVQNNRKVNKTGKPQFDHHDIVSAGPDRDYMSQDDIAWTVISQENKIGGWWSNADQMADINPHGITQPGIQRRFDRIHYRGRGAEQLRFLRQNQFMDRDAAANRAPGMGGGFGGALPMAAPAPGFAPQNHAMELQKGMPGRELAEAKQMLGADAKNEAGGGGAASGQAPVRIREYFPETMLWQPALITDDNGNADLAINFADSITTWRLTASANSHSGALGSTTVPLTVFQDFFVDIDLPVNLTQNDEVAMPVAVYNYLKTPQTVQLKLEQEPWFTLIDDRGLTRSLKLQPGEVTGVNFRIKAHRIGNQTLTVKAFGSRKSDAIRRVVEVVPDGQKKETVINDRLTGRVTQTVEIPGNALPDASKLIVRIYPGVMAQVVEGLEGMMGLPGGCFEQTSSSAYPNILIVDYIKKNRLTTPDLLMKAEQYLNTGYQRLLTFERPGGGFDWWGRDPALVWLSAYGLQEFNDMSKVWPIDKGIIDRTQNFLLSKMDAKEGTWADIGATHSETIANLGNPKLLLTSYVAWSLLESGLPKDRVKKSIDYIRGHVNEAGDNAYILALAANALADYDAKDDSTLEVLRKLDKLQQALPKDNAICFPCDRTTLTAARGNYVTVETTALTVMAMVKSGQFNNSVNKALTYLIKSKEGNGTWGSTSATILSLKALLSAMGGPEIAQPIDFTISVNGKEAARSQVTKDNADVMQLFDLKDVTEKGSNEVQIHVQGDTPLMYQLVGRYYLPWEKAPTVTKEPEFQINVSYDRTKLPTHDLLKAKATVTYNGKQPATMVMVDLGIPPGFNVDAGDFAELADQNKIARFSVTSRQVLLYLRGMRPGETRTYDYSMRARFPLRAQTPTSTVYEYYTPSNRATTQPVTLTVTDQE